MRAKTRDRLVYAAVIFCIGVTLGMMAFSLVLSWQAYGDYERMVRHAR